MTREPFKLMGKKFHGEQEGIRWATSQLIVCSSFPSVIYVHLILALCLKSENGTSIYLYITVLCSLCGVYSAFWPWL